MKSDSIYAIITARGGSKGLPGKNIKLLNGKPLIAYTISAALNCPLIQRCIVTTDDGQIKTTSKEYGAEVFNRPSELATDEASSNSAIRHVLEILHGQDDLPAYFALLQPTSPLRTVEHLEDSISIFIESGANCLISVTEETHSPYKDFCLEEGGLVPLFDVDTIEVPRQSLPKVYKQNGAIYIVKSELFLQYNRFYIQPAVPYMMSAEHSIDIDTQLDLSIAEILLKSAV